MQAGNQIPSSTHPGQRKFFLVDGILCLKYMENELTPQTQGGLSEPVEAVDETSCRLRGVVRSVFVDASAYWWTGSACYSIEPAVYIIETAP